MFKTIKITQKNIPKIHEKKTEKKIQNLATLWTEHSGRQSSKSVRDLLFVRSDDFMHTYVVGKYNNS